MESQEPEPILSQIVVSVLSHGGWIIASAGLLFYPLGMRTIQVSAAVIKSGDRILATERGYGAYKGHWEFPGGKREAGESGDEAVIREIREELGVQIAVDSLLGTIEHGYDDFHLIMDCYICHIVEGRITLMEHEAMRWLSSDELDGISWLPADMKVLDLIREGGVV